MLIVSVLLICLAAATTAQDRAEEILKSLEDTPVFQPPEGAVPDVEEEPQGVDGEYIYSVKTSAAPSSPAERFPRCIMITLPGKQCPPCVRMKADFPDLISNKPTSQVQWVDADSDVTPYGLKRSDIEGYGCPQFYILEAPGTIHRLPSGSICRQTGGKSRSQLIAYLTHSTHNVDLAPLPEQPPDEPAVTCTVNSSKWSCVPTALAGHLARIAEDPAQHVSSLFDITVDVDDALPELLSRLMQKRRWSDNQLGISVTIPETTSIRLSTTGISFSTPLLVSYSGSLVTVNANLAGIAVSPDGKTLTLDLQGRGRLPVPDLTVVLK